MANKDKLSCKSHTTGGQCRGRYLVVLQKDGWADGVEEDSIRAPAELVAQGVV